MVAKSTTVESCQDWEIRGSDAAEKTIAAIHQPNYIPWLGYFFKISRAHRFVFLDTVPYSNGSFTNRNAIKTPNGSGWLTIPVLKSGRSGQLISEVETNTVCRWEGRHLATLRSNYGRAPFFKEILAVLEPHYRVGTNDRKSLAEFNIDVIRAICEYLCIRTQCIRSSQLKVSGNKTDLLLDICRTIGANTYLAGTGGKTYQEDIKFKDAGITPAYSSFSQQPYPQLFGEFVGNLSIVDALMNCGYRGTRRLLDMESH
jgi:WbqC-like protein family